MVKIHFTLEDLVKLKVVSTLGPMVEAVFALHLFNWPSKYVSDDWRRQVRDRIGDRLTPLERLGGRRDSLHELLSLVRKPGEPGKYRRGRSGYSRDQLTAVLSEFWQVAVLPYWAGASACQEAERDMRGRIAITNGVGSMLDTLHPKVIWEPPVLHVPGDEVSKEIHLDGHGLVLSPSVFLSGKENLVMEGWGKGGVPALAYPIASDARDKSGHWWASVANDQALGELIGHTRGAAMKVLTETCTTGQLSNRLGISLAGASKHATVLRQTGLVSTVRHRNMALHTLTPLGLALLNGKTTMPCSSNTR